MKKFFLVFALVAILGTGTAFAEHPDGFGIGVFGSYGIGFNDYYGNGMGIGLSLVIPKLPIYWGVNLRGGGGWFGTGGWFGFGITGDYYIIDMDFLPFMGWHFGLGGFFNFSSWKYDWYSRADLSFGIRVPIALHFHPLEWMDIWVGIAPSFGLQINGRNKWKNNYIGTKNDGNRLGFAGWIPLEIGIRFWL
ncbi:MAG: hypothetical protein FWH41_01230 [Treponema sp.]|nr:hypothetical protein [Treponema sp.]